MVLTLQVASASTNFTEKSFTYLRQQKELAVDGKTDFYNKL